MKRAMYSITGILVAIALALIPLQGTAVAAYGGSWVFPLGGDASYQVVDVSQAVQTAPAWLQQFSEGIKIDQPTKVCYTFRHGQFNWVPRFLQLSDGKWSAVATTKEYLYGEEGSLFACAQPTVAGTLVLFAYYSGPAEAPQVSAPAGKLFTVDHWSMVVGEPREQDFHDIYAYDVNWSGYPTATRLAWGIEMCWESEDDCRSNWDDYINISGMAYPQHYTVPVFIDSNMSFAGSGGFCRMAPFVELLDAAGNVLERIYYISDYVNYCVS